MIQKIFFLTQKKKKKIHNCFKGFLITLQEFYKWKLLMNC